MPHAPTLEVTRREPRPRPRRRLRGALRKARTVARYRGVSLLGLALELLNGAINGAYGKMLREQNEARSGRT